MHRLNAAPLVPALCLSLVAGLAACQEGSTAAASGSASAAAAWGAAPGAFRDDDGRTITVEKRDGYGYTLRDASGAKVGKVKVEGDRVKVKDGNDAEVAKVKKKDDGFKVYDGSDKTLLKAKLKDGKLRFKDEAGNDVARIPAGDLRAVDAVAGLNAYQRLAVSIYLTDVEGR